LFVSFGSGLDFLTFTINFFTINLILAFEHYREAYGQIKVKSVTLQKKIVDTEIFVLFIKNIFIDLETIFVIF
jgi:hypothetical protein